MLSEFDLIARFFTRSAPPNPPSVTLGIGDDCALLRPSDGHSLAISTDMLVVGRHFFAEVDPQALGEKSLMVNLSDLAAMGAKPLAFTLAIALPEIDEAWLGGFSKGLFAAADAYDCALIGGDTTRGPLTISITVFGELPHGTALRRDAARAGDDIWVSGTPGDAAAGLAALRGELALAPDHRAQAIARLERPTARVALGIALRGIAHAAIDVSDGLLGDLGHILERSACGADIQANAIPRSAVLGDLPDAVWQPLALNGGDDYELCFTAPSHHRDRVEAAGRAAGCAVHRIGQITATPGCVVRDEHGRQIPLASHSFDHFRSP